MPSWPPRGGVCRLRPGEDSARFLLLGALLALYLLLGAAVFSALERPAELRSQRFWNATLDAFSRRHRVRAEDARRLLRQYELAMVAGVRTDALRPRWDFAGALCFVGTVVSTIGFGMTTPATVTGKVFLVFYGLLGCAGTLLFLNLFLERAVTLLAVVLQGVRGARLRRRGVYPETGGSPPGGWKPSVYTVMGILGAAAGAVSLGASCLYSAAEGWSYGDALYFCFVAFSTIGFGDLVSGQRGAPLGSQPPLYGLGNFACILLGVCCTYSLFNVISILIKELLTWLLERAGCPARRRPAPPRARARRPPGLPAAPAPPPGRRARPRAPPPPAASEVSMDTEAVFDSETDARRVSLETSAIRDFLAAPPSPTLGGRRRRLAWGGAEAGEGVPRAGEQEEGGGDRERAETDAGSAPQGAAAQRGHSPSRGASCSPQGERVGSLLDSLGSLAVMHSKLAETCRGYGQGRPHSARRDCLHGDSYCGQGRHGNHFHSHTRAPSPSHSHRLTPSHSPSHTRAPSPSHSHRLTPSHSPSHTRAPSPSHSHRLTPSHSPSHTRAPSPSHSHRLTPSHSPSHTRAPSPSHSHRLTPSHSPSHTRAPSPSHSHRLTPSHSPSHTRAPSPSHSHRLTPSHSPSHTRAPSPSHTHRLTPSHSPSHTRAPSPSHSHRLTPSHSPSHTRAPSPSHTHCLTPSHSPSHTRAPSPSHSHCLTPSHSRDRGVQAGAGGPVQGSGSDPAVGSSGLGSLGNLGSPPRTGAASAASGSQTGLSSSGRGSLECGGAPLGDPCSPTPPPERGRGSQRSSGAGLAGVRKGDRPREEPLGAVGSLAVLKDFFR
ncbi:serine/arginine repetitive matrix protein 1-like [Lepisosteus oculatus]|uniref:serine/arginine repetitive matrix protein 1-like n=1 Tax=Lepisosteus oculatus TaxID=7918 RepID=UPI0035F4FF2E